MAAAHPDAVQPDAFLSRWVPDYESNFASMMAPKPLTVNVVINFQGLSNGGSGQPQNFNQEDFSLRNDFSSRSRAGATTPSRSAAN